MAKFERTAKGLPDLMNQLQNIMRKIPGPPFPQVIIAKHETTNHDFFLIKWEEPNG